MVSANSADGVVELVRFVDAVDDPESRGLLGVDRTAGEDEILRDAGTRDVSEALVPPPPGGSPRPTSSPTVASGVATRADHRRARLPRRRKA